MKKIANLVGKALELIIPQDSASALSIPICSPCVDGRRRCTILCSWRGCKGLIYYRNC